MSCPSIVLGRFPVLICHSSYLCLHLVWLPISLKFHFGTQMEFMNVKRWIPCYGLLTTGLGFCKWIILILFSLSPTTQAGDDWGVLVVSYKSENEGMHVGSFNPERETLFSLLSLFYTHREQYPIRIASLDGSLAMNLVTVLKAPRLVSALVWGITYSEIFEEGLWW